MFNRFKRFVSDELLELLKPFEPFELLKPFEINTSSNYRYVHI